MAMASSRLSEVPSKVGLFLPLIKTPYLQPALHISRLFVQKHRCRLSTCSVCSCQVVRDWGSPARDVAGGDGGSVGWESMGA